MKISVVIATYNRATLLDECLSHLARQQFERGDEIIIVDNGSTDATPAIVQRHRNTIGVPLHFLEEPRPGKSNALARGLAIAGGDIVAFTDDDVDVDDLWLAAIRKQMSDTDVALVGGRVTPRFEARTPWWLPLRDGYGRLAAPLALLDYGSEPAELGARTFLGANLAVRRSVLERIGGFAPHLGKLRGTLLSGEDDEFCRRVQAAGFRARYCPDLRVRHFVPASRMRLGYFLSWFFWSGITNAALDEDVRTRRGGLFGLPLYFVRRFVAGVVGCPIAALTGNRAAALDMAMNAAVAAGYAAKCWGFVTLEPAPQPITAGDAA